MSGERFETIRIGSYEILRSIARGGMAELFLASGPDGLVAIKKILPEHAAHPRLMQLFLDEAGLAARFDHPNIVRVFDASDARAGSFFAMEFVHGPDLRSMLHRSWTFRDRMPIRHGVHVAAQLAAALHYAHELRGDDDTILGVVHRDVSPSNVLVSYEGAVKLVDFGVAKAATSSVKTRTGALKGKISYMSPEQARGAPLDRRSDIFSLGIVLWEMVTTQRLFRGQNDLDTLHLVMNEPVRPPSSVEPACSPELERIILRALARDPDARYQTAAELGRDLEALDASPDEPAALADYVAQLFAPEVAAWREAQAAGISLADHLTSSAELTIPVASSDFIEEVDLAALLEEESELSETMIVPQRLSPMPRPSPIPRPSPAPGSALYTAASVDAEPISAVHTPVYLAPPRAPQPTGSSPWPVASGSTSTGSYAIVAPRTPPGAFPAPAAPHTPPGTFAAVPPPSPSLETMLDAAHAARLQRGAVYVLAAIVVLIIVVALAFGGA